MENNEKEIYKQIGDLTLRIDETGANLDLLIERGKLYLKIEKRDMALNDFKLAVSIDPNNVEANSYIEMIESIDSYFYNQMYNV